MWHMVRWDALRSYIIQRILNFAADILLPKIFQRPEYPQVSITSVNAYLKLYISESLYVKLQHLFITICNSWNKFGELKNTHRVLILSTVSKLCWKIRVIYLQLKFLYLFTYQVFCSPQQSRQFLITTDITASNWLNDEWLHWKMYSVHRITIIKTWLNSN